MFTMAWHIHHHLTFMTMKSQKNFTSVCLLRSISCPFSKEKNGFHDIKMLQLQLLPPFILPWHLLKRQEGKPPKPIETNQVWFLPSILFCDVSSHLLCSKFSSFVRIAHLFSFLFHYNQIWVKSLRIFTHARSYFLFLGVSS